MTDPAQEILDLIRQGHTIAAIKLVREHTGMGLADAKAVVDRVVAGEALGPLMTSSRPATPTGPAALPAKVRELARRGEKIEAIKLLREQTGLGLREAKDLVDQVPVEKAVQKSGCLTALVLAAAAAGALALWS